MGRCIRKNKTAVGEVRAVGLTAELGGHNNISTSSGTGGVIRTRARALAATVSSSSTSSAPSSSRMKRTNKAVNNAELMLDNANSEGFNQMNSGENKINSGRPGVVITVAPEMKNSGLASPISEQSNSTVETEDKMDCDINRVIPAPATSSCCSSSNGASSTDVEDDRRDVQKTGDLEEQEESSSSACNGATAEVGETSGHSTCDDSVNGKEGERRETAEAVIGDSRCQSEPEQEEDLELESSSMAVRISNSGSAATPPPPRRPPRTSVKKVTPLKPSAAELEEFFAAAEKNLQNRFKEKYNFDVVKDVPLEGRFEWVPLKQ